MKRGIARTGAESVTFHNPKNVALGTFFEGFTLTVEPLET